MQAPPTHPSFGVHLLPSSQAALLAVNVHPIKAAPPSSVQGLPSVHGSAAPGLQAPPAHTSLVVHRSPSSHGAVLNACLQPVAGSQEWVVHGLPSSHSRAPAPTQLPPAHPSVGVHALPSSQSALLAVN